MEGVKMNKRNKVLLLTDFYEPRPSANGICIKKISIELIKLGYDVHVICYGKKNEKLDELVDGVNVHRVRCPKFYQIRENVGSKKNGEIAFLFARIIRYFRILFYFYNYPLIYPRFAKKYYKLSSILVKQDGISTVIAEYLPIESIYTAIKLKQYGVKIKVNAYVVDTFTQGINEINHPLFGKTSLRWEKKILRACDNYFCLTNFTEYYMENEYNHKINFVGLPLITDSVISRKEKNNDSIVVMYSGTWGGERNPINIMKSIEVLNKQGKNITFIYCGKNNSLTKKLVENYTFFKDYGFLNENQINAVAKNVDCLINIGNSTNMLPSKLFSYFSLGLPIVHFFLDEKDPCLSFLKKYPASKVLNLNNFTCDEFYDGIESIRKKTMVYSEISDLYKEYTAEFIARALV